MPLEAATYINQLVATNPIHTDPLSASDSHMRLIKQVLQNTFPQVNGAVSASSADLSGGIIPIGGIIIWTGTYAAIPANYRLCDGNNGTPNLEGRFVLGAGVTSVVQGGVGGSSSTTTDGSHNHPGGGTDSQGSHSHNTSAAGTTSSDGGHSHGGGTAAHALSVAEMPSHTHFGGSLQVAAVSGGNLTSSTPWYQVGNSGGQAIETPQGGGAGHSHALSTDGGHTHTVSTTGSTDASGAHAHNVALGLDGSHSHSLTPPFYALYYIMRIF
jgi:hypothetical protein